jgi:uncharacterized protein YceK
MLERILRSVAAILIACLLLPGCSTFSSSSAKKQAAYQKYIRKNMSARAKQQAKFHSTKAPRLHAAPPSEVKATATAEAQAGPQSVTAAAETQANE